MEVKTKEWLDSLDERKDSYIRLVYNIDKWFDKFSEEEREEIARGVEDSQERSIYGVDGVTSKIIRTYVYSDNRKNMTKLQQEMYAQFPMMTRKELSPYLLQNSHPFHYMSRAYTLLMNEVFDRRVDAIETSIGDIRNVNYKYLRELSNPYIALELQRRAHDKGICLDGEIPEDLILIQDFMPKPLRNVFGIISNDRKPLYSCLSDFTTQFKSSEELEKAMLKLDGVGPKKAKQIVNAVLCTCSPFESREEKVLKYKLEMEKRK